MRTIVPLLLGVTLLLAGAAGRTRHGDELLRSTAKGDVLTRGGEAPKQLAGQSAAATDGPPTQKESPTDFPSDDTGAPFPHGVFPPCPVGQPTCNILVVVDMQKDYCKGCGSPTESKWASEGLREIVGPINSIIEKAGDGLDLVVFTQDWLRDGKPFLVHDTLGASVLDELNQPEGKSVHFTKSIDDWMNHNFFRGRRYAIKGETPEGNARPESLDMILSHYGYTPEKTHIYVAGTATYRCVMKGSVHARSLGYTVSLVEDSIEGDGDESDWKRYSDPNNADPVKPSCREYVGGRPGKHCSRVERLRWMRTIYDTAGGPSPELRRSILHNARVRSCANADAVAAAIRGHLCRVSRKP